MSGMGEGIVEVVVRRLCLQQGQGEKEGIMCHSLRVKQLRWIQEILMVY